MAPRASRWARTIVGLYPRAWRARYEAELLALVEEEGASWRTIVDLAVGAGRERASHIVAAYGSALLDRSIFSARVCGVRVAIFLVGNLLAGILSAVVTVRVVPRNDLELEVLYVVGLMALLARTGWLGRVAHRDRRLPLSSRAPARVEAIGWMGAAIALGALSNRGIHFSVQAAYAFATRPIESAIVSGTGGIMLMCAFDAFVKQAASHRRWLAAQAGR